MKLIVDTNVLLRITTLDDRVQARAAADALRDAETIAIPLPALCEFCWTLTRSYKKAPSDVAAAIRRWTALDGVEVDRDAVDAGLRILDAGGDFADGVIASEGRRLGGDTFITFDRKAANVLERFGYPAFLLEGSVQI